MSETVLQADRLQHQSQLRALLCITIYEKRTSPSIAGSDQIDFSVFSEILTTLTIAGILVLGISRCSPGNRFEPPGESDDFASTTHRVNC
jgi:hypothetical protein